MLFDGVFTATCECSINISFVHHHRLHNIILKLKTRALYQSRKVVRSPTDSNLSNK